MKKYLLLITLLVTTLTGCVAAVVIGAATGLVVYDRRSMLTIERDLHIYHRISAAINADENFKRSHISIVSFNAMVLLVGQVKDQDLKLQLEKIAKTIPEAKKVYNEVTIAEPLSMRERSYDGWITSQIRSLMLAQKGLESGSIRIVTEDRIVYLMGMVSSDQANLAANIARKVKGVNKVVKIFQYIA